MQDGTADKQNSPGENERGRLGVVVGLVALVAIIAAGTFILRSRSSPQSGTPAAPVAGDPAIRPSSGGELLLIPAGQFTMGQAGGRPDETPHSVSISSFYMDRDLVTQELYEKVMGANPSTHIGQRFPVERVQWVDAVRFCNKCSEVDGLSPCYDLTRGTCNFAADGYRLPTEAEWEYACRAGTHTKFFYGDDPADATKYAWCKPESEGTTHAIGQKLPNPLGLDDMLGNVWEWCGDWYADSYDQTASSDPHGPATGKQRVLRGGAWDCTAENCTPAHRAKEFPRFTDACFGADTYGFRRVRTATASAPTIASTPQSQPAVAAANPSTAPVVAVAIPAKTDPPPAGKLQASQLKGTIIFVSNRTGTLNIWSMHADGSEQKPLTNDKDPHADPRFSPDGKSILQTVLHGGFPEVWVMNRDGSSPRKITAGSQADWSPDGQQIAFIRDNQMWTRNLASGQEQRITPEGWERCGTPAWRPDGKQLAVASRHTGAVAIYLLSLDGKQITPLATEEESCTPHWSADGNRLLCQTVKGHVHQVGADGKDWEQETDGADVQHEGEYSPDGSTFVFCRAPTSDGPWNICVSRIGDENMDFVQLTTEGSNLQPDWRGD